MDRTRLLQGLGAFSILGGAIAIWYAFQRQMCTAVATVGDVESQCGPNVVYLVPGTIVALVGIAVVLYLHRRGRAGLSLLAEK